MSSATQQFEFFIGRYDSTIAASRRPATDLLRQIIPSAHGLVYDNDNALVIGVSPSEQESQRVLSIAACPR